MGKLYNEYGIPGSEQPSRFSIDGLLSRDELTALTGTKQPKRMCAWLDERRWAYEPPARRGDFPKVLREYRNARLSGHSSERRTKANLSFMTQGRA